MDHGGVMCAALYCKVIGLDGHTSTRVALVFIVCLKALDRVLHVFKVRVWMDVVLCCVCFKCCMFCGEDKTSFMRLYEIW